MKNSNLNLFTWPILLLSFILQGCATTIKTHCADGSTRRSTNKCSLNIKYQAPSVETGVFELPIINGLKTPTVIAEKNVSPEVLRHIAEKVKNIEFRYIATCEKLKRYACEPIYFALKRDLEGYEKAIHMLTKVYQETKTADEFKIRFVQWMKLFTTKRQYQARLDSGDDLLISKEYQKAVEEYKLAQDYSNKAGLHYRLGLAYQEIARVDDKMIQNYWIEAFNSFAKCYGLDENYTPCALEIALMTMQKSQSEGGGFDTSLETLKALENKDSDPQTNLYIKYNIGLIYYRMDQMDPAKEKFFEVLNSNQKDLFLEVFTNFKLSLAYAHLAESATEENKETWTNNTLHHVHQALRLAKAKGLKDLKANLLAQFNSFKSNLEKVLGSHPRWPEIEKEYLHLTHH